MTPSLTGLSDEQLLALSQMPDAASGETYLEGLAPGDYTVLAFDHMDDLEYANPDVLAPYLAESAHVRLDRGGEATVSVKLIHREKP